MTFELFIGFVSQVCFGMLLVAVILFLTFTGLYFLACASVKVFHGVPEFIDNWSRVRSVRRG
jgi:hypothetical protein